MERFTMLYRNISHYERILEQEAELAKKTRLEHHIRMALTAIYNADFRQTATLGAYIDVPVHPDVFDILSDAAYTLDTF